MVIPTVPLPSTAAAAATTVAPVLPNSCAGMIPGNDLDTALGARLSSTVDVVLGQAQPDIGRTGRITCRYGTPAGGAYPVEISLTSYASAGEADDRVGATVAAAERQGLGSQQVVVGEAQGLYIPYPSGGTVIAAAGIYTVAVTLGPGSVPDAGPARGASTAGMVLAQAGR